MQTEPDGPANDDAYFVGPFDDPNRYQILQTLGGGGEGVVHKAQWSFRGSKQYAAIKELSAPGMTSQQAEAAFNDQVQLLSFYNMPGIVSASYFAGAPEHHRDQTVDGVVHYLRMTFVEGKTFNHWVEDKRRTMTGYHEIALALLQVAMLLDHLASGARTNGVVVVHGDVKPLNIVVDSNGQAWLVDFGLATVAGALRTGISPGYAFQDMPLGAAADRFALACVASFAFTGQHPPDKFDTATFERLLANAPLLADKPGVIADIAKMYRTRGAATGESPATRWAKGLTNPATNVGLAILPRARHRWGWAAAAIAAVLAITAVVLHDNGSDGSALTTTTIARIASTTPAPSISVTTSSSLAPTTAAPATTIAATTLAATTTEAATTTTTSVLATTATTATTTTTTTTTTLPPTEPAPVAVNLIAANTSYYLGNQTGTALTGCTPKVDGSSRPGALCISGDCCYVGGNFYRDNAADFNLGRHFKRFTALVAVDDLSSPSVSVSVTISSEDGTILLPATSVRLGQSFPVDIGVTNADINALRLHIDFHISGSGTVTIVLANPMAI